MAIQFCTDKEALTWLRDGSADAESKAITCLYRRLLTHFSPWVLSRGGSHEDAHDAVTDALIEFVQQFREGKYREMGKLEHLLFRIAQRRFYDRFEEGGTKYLVDTDLDKTGEDPQEQAEQTAEAARIQSQLEQCLVRLGERCKERLVRYWYWDQSHEEIARALGDANARVSITMKNRCMEKLKKCMENQLLND